MTESQNPTIVPARGLHPPATDDRLPASAGGGLPLSRRAQPFLGN